MFKKLSKRSLEFRGDSSSAASIKFALIIRCVYPRYILRLLLLYLRMRDSLNSLRVVYNNPLQSSYFTAVLRREIKRRRYVSRTPAFQSINPLAPLPVSVPYKLTFCASP